MANHSLTFAAAALASLVLAGCRDVSTEVRRGPERGGGAILGQAAPNDTGGGGSGRFHFVSNGDFGNANWSSSTTAIADSGPPPGGFVFGFVGVSRGGTANNPQAFLFYNVFQCDAFGCNTVAGGNGEIPVRDLTGSGSNSLRVNTNTANDPNFFVFAGSGGVVNVAWRANSLFSSHNTGTSEQQSGNFRLHTNGVSDFSTATAMGSVVGFVIAENPFNSMGTNHSVVTEIFH